jgi:hypothetical protein
VFYTYHASRRGNLLYRRYDGDLGLISPTPGDSGAALPLPSRGTVSS